VTDFAGPDIVIPLRRGAWNDELRYTLRSIEANVPHHRIVIVGGSPDWLRPAEGLIHLPREQTASKWQNSIGNVEHAIKTFQDSELPLSPGFLLFNDDFYVMRPIERMPVYTQGRLSERIEIYRRKHHTGAYWRGMVETYVRLKQLGFGDPLSYGLHMPLPIYPGVYLDAIAKGKGIEALHMRTLYGNLAYLGGEVREDVKVHHQPQEAWSTDYLSSNDNMHLNGMEALLRNTFPMPSRYEVEP
jgi:hypothetical protein